MGAGQRLRPLIGAPDEVVEVSDGLLGGGEIAFGAVARIEEEVGRSRGRNRQKKERGGRNRGHPLPPAGGASRQRDEIDQLRLKLALERGDGGLGVGESPPRGDEPVLASLVREPGFASDVDVSDDEWALVAPYLTLLPEDPG